MGELIILPLQLTVAAGTSGTHDIAVAPEGRKLILSCLLYTSDAADE